MTPDPPTPPSADPAWFRPPTRREHWLGVSLFLTFAIFFLALGVLQRPSWFAWPLLVLSLLSLLRALKHARAALTIKASHPTGGPGA